MARHDQYSPRITAHLGELADDIIGSIIDGSSLSGLLTRVEIGHIRIGSAGNVASSHAWTGSLAKASGRNRTARG